MSTSALQSLGTPVAGGETDTVVELQQIRKHYGSLEVLNGLSLSVNQGEVYGFLGRNGAGKSTAIRIMMGITHLDGGSVRLFGQPLDRNPIGARQRIGYVAQEQNFYPWMTPKTLGSFVRGFYPRWNQQQFQLLLDNFDLPPRRRIGTFSGGMKAKLALSFALATRPELLILDEPTAGMDPVARREFLDLVAEQAVREGATTLFSTHLIDDIEAVADRIGIVDAGVAIYEGELAPLSDTIASYSIDVSDAVVRDGGLPGEFAAAAIRTLQDTVRHGRRVLVLQYHDRAPHNPVLEPGWRLEPMSLEDVFIAVVAKSL
jgi:ABC-2 type transport system ATP-binding protein